MDVDALIDNYVRDVVERLPRKQRGDVALELRGLVRDELQSKAASDGHPLDEQIALEGLRAFGRPQDVAARYFEPWVIIAPTDTRRFAFAAVIGALVLTALSPLGNGPATSSQLGIAIFAWLGVLVAYFGLQSILHRRGSDEWHWTPRDADRVNRAGSLALIALIGIGIITYGAPGWLFSQLTHGQTLSHSLDYDPGFKASRLPVLFAVWGCQAILFAVLAIRGRWNPALRWVAFALEAAIVLVLIWYVAAGQVFQAAALNKAALNTISVFVLLLSIDLGVKLYRGVSWRK